MTRKSVAWGGAALMLASVLPGCAGDATEPPIERVPVVPVFASVSEPVTMTAEPYLRRTTEHDWAIAQGAVSGSLSLDGGQSGTVSYTIDYTRTTGPTEERYGLAGEICVMNTAGVAAQLVLLENLMYANGVLFRQTAVDYGANPILDSMEIGCYRYEVNGDPGAVPPAGYVYTSRARVSGVAVGTTGPSSTAYSAVIPFVWPSAPTEVIDTDGSAQLASEVQCPTGFSCTPAAVNWQVEGSGSQPITVRVQNLGARCASQFEVSVRSLLTEADTRMVRGEASGAASVSTGSCTACSPLFWQGTAGRNLWNMPADAHWNGAFQQPFTNGTQFNSFFSPSPELQSKSMLQMLRIGAGASPLSQAARSLVAAYLNASNGNFVYSQAELSAAWAAALARGRRGLQELHEELDDANKDFVCRY